MSKLVDYVLKHTVRGDCQCSVCANPHDSRPKVQPNGHAADVFFFKVGLVGSPEQETLRGLVKEHAGAFGNVDPYDGKEHSYIELGGWIGDQGVAMQFMGLSNLLGLGNLMTPNMLPGLPEELKQLMAGQGLVSFMSPAPGA